MATATDRTKLDAILRILSLAETPAEKREAQALVQALLGKESLQGVEEEGGEGEEEEEDSASGSGGYRRTGTLLRYLRDEAPFSVLLQQGFQSSSDADDDPGRTLAQFYADLFNDLSQAGSPPDDATVEIASEELDPLGWTIDRDETGFWYAAPIEQVEEVKGPLRLMRTQAAWQYAAERAPKGGITIAGTFYPGGRFIPGKVMEVASFEDRQRLSEARNRVEREKAAQQATPKKQKAQAVAASALPAQVTHTDPQVVKSATRSLNALKRHHGEKTLDRIGALTEEVEKAIARAKPEKKAGLQKRLAELAVMAKMVGSSKQSSPVGPTVGPTTRELIDASFAARKEGKVEEAVRLMTEAMKRPDADAVLADRYTTKPREHRPLDEVADKPTRLPQLSLADDIAKKLSAGEHLSSGTLRELAGQAYGGTMAEGKYDYSGATDAMEAGFNRSLVGQSDPRAGLFSAQKQAQAIADRVNLLPTQTNRSGEKDAYQQFSTPPHYAFAAAWAANIREGEPVLEPSAGTGCLAVQAANAGGVVYANELSKRRMEFLKDLLGVDRVSNENAEQISAILKGKIPAPSVVVMNPPFSQTAGRMGNKKELLTGARHIDEALSLLAPGGRLVAIVGRGMTTDSPTYREWFAGLKQKYNLRANIGVPGGEYKKYGTQFDTRVLVIDKTGPQTSAEVYDEAADIPHLMALLEGVRNDRATTNQQSSAQSASGKDAAASPAAGSNPSATGNPVVAGATRRGGKGVVGAGGKPTGQGSGMGDVAPGGGLSATGTGSDGSAAGQGVGNPPGSPVATASSTGRVRRKQPAADSGGKPAGQSASDQPELRPAVKVAVQAITPEELRKQARAMTPPEPLFTGIDALGREWINGKLKPAEEDPAAQDKASLYEGYRPQLLKIPGAAKHTTPLVESAAMASVLPPTPTYQPSLSPDVIEKGILSEAQLESLVYAGQAHEQFLPAGEGQQPARRGYFIGDGTGVGKGRQIAGIIADNVNQGRTKHVWVSQKQNLLEDAQRDWQALGMNPANLHHFDKIRNSATPPAEGVGFITYDTLKGRPKDASKPSNLEELVNWLGKDFDGVIAFDEAHGMANAITTKGARGDQEASQKALAGIKLQQMLPNARIVYVSATGATEVSNLAYAERLGLWGRGTAFPDKSQFIDQMNKGGVAAMEAVAQSMKAMGAYNARSLSFDDGTPTGRVTYDRVTHKLTPEQKFQYDTAAKAWQEVLKNIDEALKLTGGSQSRNAKSAAVSQFWGAQQRFFNQVMTSMQTPSVIRAMEADIAEGRAPVVQLVNTMEAATKRAKERMGEGDDFEDMDVSPKEVLMQYLEKSFPVHRYEEYYDEQSKSTLVRPVMDSEGKPVTDPQAEEIRDRLLDMLGTLRIPESPLDMIINHFGHENVAEATGRTQRIVSQEQEDGSRKKVLERRNITSANAADTQAFQSGKKKLLVFSDAGGTGRSYHADRDAENQKQRVHYMLQPGWRADNAVQGLGRTHRTNQAVAPTYRLVEIEDLKAQKRFISTIARRLDQLGALTRGQRQAGGGGLFAAADNLESYEASEALGSLFRDLRAGKVEGVDYDEVMTQLGYKTEDDGRSSGRRGRVKEIEPPPMSQFLNRLLSLEVDMQGKVFDAFDSRLKQAVEIATKNGTLDRGVENFKAESVRKASDNVVFKDASSGAEVRHLVTKVKQRAQRTSWDQTLRGELPMGYVVNNQSGRVYAYYAAHDYTDARTGSVEPQYKLVGPTSDHYRKTWEVTGYSWGGGSDKFQKITPEQAQQYWDKEYAEAPEFVERDEHFLAGALLPIWDRIPGEKPKIYRLKTDDGQSTVARHVPRKLVDQMLKNMGIAGEGSKPRTPAEVHTQLSAGKVGVVTLANGWRLKPVRVQGERRIEVIGPSAYYGNELAQDGVISERINYNTRFFVPTGQDGAKILERITVSRPITDVEEPEHHARPSALCLRYCRLARQARRRGDCASARIYARQANEIRNVLRFSWENRGQVDTNASGEAVYNWVNTDTGESRRQHIEPGSSQSRSVSKSPEQPEKERSDTTTSSKDFDAAADRRLADFTREQVVPRLSPRHKDAILRYTKHFYRGINLAAKMLAGLPLNSQQAARAGINDEDQLAPIVEESVRPLDEAFASSPPLPEPVTVLRGIDIPFESVADYLDAFEEDRQSGRTCTFPGFGSCSLVPDQAAYFAQPAKGSAGQQIVFEITAKKGIYVNEVLGKHEFEDQKELLLPRMSAFRVKGIHQGEKITIQLEQVWDESEQAKSGKPGSKPRENESGEGTRLISYSRRKHKNAWKSAARLASNNNLQPCRKSQTDLARQYARLARRALARGDTASARIYARQSREALRYAWENRGQVDTNASGEAVYNWVNTDTGESRRQHIEPGSSGRGGGSAAPQPATTPPQPAGQPAKQPTNSAPAPATPQEPKPYGPSKAKVKYRDSKQKQQVAKIVKDLFGDKLSTPEQVASVVGAPDDAKVTLLPSADGKFLFAHIDHPSFHRTCERYIGKDSQGRTFMHNEIIDIKGDRFRASVGYRSIDGPADRIADYIAREEGIEWADALKQIHEVIQSGKPGKVGRVEIKQTQKSLQGNGLGSQIFGRQVEQAKAAGVSYIECHAARKSATGHDYFNGYYTWPRMGYNQSIEDVEKTDKQVAEKIRERFPDAKDILDVMATKEGQAWWKENGVDLHHAEFDLTSGSKSLQRLDGYRKEIASRPPREAKKPQQPAGFWGWLSRLWS